MLRFKRALLSALVAAVVGPAAAGAADLPGVETIFKIHEINKARLAHLHLQVKFEYGAGVPRPANPNQFRNLIPMEFFLDGENYQFRRPLWQKFGAEITSFRFPVVPLNAETLSSDYRRMALFSYCAKSATLAIWSSNDKPFVATSRKHLGDNTNVDLPPLTDVTSPPGCQSANRHPIDGFFLEPIERYRVVGQELVDGRLLAIVELIVPFKEGIIYVYRGWLDLARALPMKIEKWLIRTEWLPRLDRRQPEEITRTERVVELPNGSFYPAETTWEQWQDDPRERLREVDWDEVRSGTRRPEAVIERVHRWNCPLVEIKTDFPDDFFVIPLPPSQKVYDNDAGDDRSKNRKPPVEVGQHAPPLTIGRWLDGKERTLEGLKGQVVVLNFWGLWCGGCRAEVPELVKLQKRFAEKPVAFISIHNAEDDLDDLAQRIAAFQKEHDWNWIAAIDAGTEEASTTGDGYGVIGLPLMVIIGKDGKIVYADFMFDQDAPDVEAKVEAIMKHRFDAVGEKWPISDGLSEKEQEELIDRVEWKLTAQEIERALN